MIDDVRGMVRERVEAWYHHNKRLPTNILYYRDGISDSQYMKVKDEELKQIKQGFHDYAGELLDENKPVPSVKLTAVIVTKRHNTRFFPNPPDEGHKTYGNCTPGTLVEQGVTSPYFTEFYLQSHAGIQGTAKAARYFVLENEMGMSANELQDLVKYLLISTIVTC